MSSRLDPAHLTPAASLNRVRFVELQDVTLPPEMLGRTAFELLSARALADLVREHADTFGPARRIGERLGWLLVVLRRGDAASRAARPDWDDTYWRHWAGISTIYLGGGIASGRIGPRLVEHASRTLAEAGMAACIIQLAPWPVHLPLIGAARSAPALQSAVVLDFGHSFVKRGHAQYQAGTLAALRILPQLPARWTDVDPRTGPAAEDIRRLGDFMVATIAETWRAARAVDHGLSSTIAASLASYLRDGQPLARQGGAYSYLLELSDNLATWLSERVSSAAGHPLSVRLLHDGTAAAHARAGEEHTAVITLGTALGIGFPPASGPTCPLLPHFTLINATPD